MKAGIELANKKFIYFVSLSSNVPYVLTEALEHIKKNNKVEVFYDLDGARILDKRYLKKMNRVHGIGIESLIRTAISKGIKMYGCQMNVLIADGLELIEGAELAGVVTFLESAYQADAVLSF